MDLEYVSSSLSKKRVPNCTNPHMIVRDRTTSKEYAIILASNRPKCICIDADFMLDHNVYIDDTTGYPHCSQSPQSPLHSMIMKERGDDEIPLGHRIDHINRIKLDNRSAHLRVAPLPAKSMNRCDRSDRKEPPKELMDMGVKRMPRHVRWDNVESKLFIHPGSRNSYSSRGRVQGTCRVRNHDRARDIRIGHEGGR